MITRRLLRRKIAHFVADAFPGEKSSEDRPVSPRKNLEVYSGILKLADDVRTNCLKGGAMSNDRFLPNDKLEELVTNESVLSALRVTTIEEQNHEDLASWVVESGRRLFLILVLMTRGSTEQLSWLEHFKNGGVNDSVLPLDFSGTEPYYAYALAAAPIEGTQKFNFFKDWEDNNLILFRTYQWMFLAPVLGASNKFQHLLSNPLYKENFSRMYHRLELRPIELHILLATDRLCAQVGLGPPKCETLPFLTLAKKPAKSILGETWYGEIHPAHVDSQCLSKLEVPNSLASQGVPVHVKHILPSDGLNQFFDIKTGKFRATHPIISSRRVRPIAAYKRNGDDFVIFRWVGGESLPP
ncbi:hypothetical protein F4678DRAFT_484602 [Xylaria arbuscula]|nr:hypothetical protein F4678DRAFT_484602 [Xylaria arbuscula]